MIHVYNVNGQRPLRSPDAELCGPNLVCQRFIFWLSWSWSSLAPTRQLNHTKRAWKKTAFLYHQISRWDRFDNIDIRVPADCINSLNSLSSTQRIKLTKAINANQSSDQGAMKSHPSIDGQTVQSLNVSGKFWIRNKLNYESPESWFPLKVSSFALSCRPRASTVYKTLKRRGSNFGEIAVAIDLIRLIKIIPQRTISLRVLWRPAELSEEPRRTACSPKFRIEIRF